MRTLDDATWRLTAPVVALWRADGTLQVGLEPPAGLLIDHPEPAMERVLDALRTPCTRADLLQVGGPGADEWLDRLLRPLEAGGVLRAGHHPPGPVTVIGRGRLATRIADLLLQQLAGPVGLVWPGATGTPRAVLGLRARHADRVQFSGHWGYRAEGAGLTVVTAQAAEADRGVLTQLVADSQPFLVVRASDLGAIVGPLVAPGRSPCHRCEDLYRTSVDPAWPRLLAQLCRGRPPPERLTLHWAASTAALHALSWLEGSLPDSIGAGLELAADRQVRLRPLRAHPACGCLAYG